MGGRILRVVNLAPRNSAGEWSCQHRKVWIDRIKVLGMSVEGGRVPYHAWRLKFEAWDSDNTFLVLYDSYTFSL
jgi:hypothetical protein